MTAARPLISKYWLGTNSLFKDQETWMAIDATIWLDWTGGPCLSFLGCFNHSELHKVFLSRDRRSTGNMQVSGGIHVLFLRVSLLDTTIKCFKHTHTNTIHLVCKKAQLCLWVYAWPSSFLLHSCLTILELQNYLNTPSTVQVNLL